jgi:predicted SAM-dependent methyltransferase
MKKVLHVGAGSRTNAPGLSSDFRGPEWLELRLDIDPATDPDIVSSMVDMRAVESGSMDAVYSVHNLEHLFPHEVPVALGEFVRVLKPDGFAYLTTPDLQAVAFLVAEDKLSDVVYHCGGYPVTPIDMIYGHVEAMANGNSFMAHKTGFTAKTLKNTLYSAGFTAVMVKPDPVSYVISALAYKLPPPWFVPDRP